MFPISNEKLIPFYINNYIGIDFCNHISVIAAMSQWSFFIVTATSSILGVKDMALERSVARTK